jgi:hypothetical protein
VEKTLDRALTRGKPGRPPKKQDSR